jgi:hypothetical protein
MPCDDDTLAKFISLNKGKCSLREQETLRKLNQESSNNQKLEIQVTANK